MKIEIQTEASIKRIIDERERKMMGRIRLEIRALINEIVNEELQLLRKYIDRKLNNENKNRPKH